MMTKVICIEGMTSTGKTTLVAKISEFLNKKNKTNLIVYEKAYESFKQIISKWSNEGRNEQFSKEFILDVKKERGEVHEKYLLPLIGKIDYLIFDRCFYTSAIYQANKNFSVDNIININLASGAIKPNFGVILLCSAETVLCRAKVRDDKKYYNNYTIDEILAKIERRRKLYIELAQKHPELYLIDHEGTEDEMFEIAKNKLGL